MVVICSFFTFSLPSASISLVTFRGYNLLSLPPPRFPKSYSPWFPLLFSSFPSKSVTKSDLFPLKPSPTPNFYFSFGFLPSFDLCPFTPPRRSLVIHRFLTFCRFSSAKLFFLFFPFFPSLSAYQMKLFPFPPL